jgi:hypothetical protein
MSRRLFALAALATSLASALIPSAAMAQDRYYYDDGDGYYRDGDGWRDRGDYDRYDGYHRYRPGDYYADNGYYGRRYYRDNRYRCRSSGATGAIVGALAGGLLGHGLSGRGDHAFGTVLGAGAGAVAGSAIERSDDRC